MVPPPGFEPGSLPRKGRMIVCPRLKSFNQTGLHHRGVALQHPEVSKTSFRNHRGIKLIKSSFDLKMFLFVLEFLLLIAKKNSLRLGSRPFTL